MWYLAIGCAVAAYILYVLQDKRPYTVWANGDAIMVMLFLVILLWPVVLVAALTSEKPPDRWFM